MNRVQHLALSLALAGCSIQEGAGESDPPSCALARQVITDDIETVLLENAEGLMKEAAFVGQATSSTRLEFIYAISLYDQLTSAGWLLAVGCTDDAEPSIPTCQSALDGSGVWSCIRPVCEDRDTLRIESWYAEDGNSELSLNDPFTLPFDATGGELVFLGNPLHSWTMDAESGYATVEADHGVLAQHVAPDGAVTDVSYRAAGHIQHGDAHPEFTLDIQYPKLSTHGIWRMTLDFGPRGLDGALWLDDVRVATVLDATPQDSDELALALDWAACAEVPAPGGEGLGCNEGTRASRLDCDSGPM